MARSSIIGTGWQDAWGTAGTHAMKPSPHIEGLGSYAARLDDRMAFLAFQQTDVVFTEEMNKLYSLPEGQFLKLDQYRIYYNGNYPQLFFAFRIDHAYPPTSVAATFSLRFKNVDFGTKTYTITGNLAVEWFADIPDSFAPGEYGFQFYGAAGEYSELLLVGATQLTFLPTRF